jgi:very-short-patch-repair endonuclease
MGGEERGDWLTLDRHQRRRAEGQATLSVVEDPAAFASWARLRGHQVVQATPGAAYRAVLDQVFGHLHHRTEPERALVVDRYAGEEPRTRQPLSVVLGLAKEAPLHEPWVLVAMLTPLPAVLIDARTLPFGSLELSMVASVCLDCTALPVALLLDPGKLDDLLRSAHGRARALLEEGVVARPPATPPLQDDPRVAKSMDRLRRDGAPKVVVEAFRALVLASSEHARSLAEALLWQLLESRPETCGRFHLNVLQPWNFGPRRAELDLFSSQWQVAIEVDGYHHFRDEQAYRRDRRKDVELQLRGIFVARVLANDLVEDVGGTFDHLLEVIRRRVGVGQGGV